MKKLSVLLVIGLFCIPILGYGFTKTGLPSVISKSISKSFQSIVKLSNRSLDKAASLIQPQAEPEIPQNPNPFFKEPSGARGTVGMIDLPNNKITLLAAQYFDEATNQLITSDLTIYMNDMTTYYMDLVEDSSLAAMIPGSVVICNGPVDFEAKEMKYAYDVYMGKFILDDAKYVLHFSTIIKNLDLQNRTFDFDYIGMDGKLITIHVIITDQTPIQYYSKASPNIPVGPELGVIPGFVKNDTFMVGDFIISQDFTAVANLITFCEN